MAAKPPQAASVGPNNPNTVVQPRCDTDPCFICRLRQDLASAPETAAASITEVPLRLNIVGVRKDNSVSNAFDDKMAVFFKLLGPEQKDRFEQAVEEDIRSDLDSRRTKSNDRVQFISCSKGLWVSAFFPVTTDPGLSKTRQSYETILKKKQEAVDKNQKDLEAKQAELDKTKERLPQAEKELAAARAAGQTPETKTLAAEIMALKKKQANLPKEITALDGKVAKGTKDLKNSQASLDDFDEENFALDPERTRWFAEARGIFAPGQYAGKFSLRAHKLLGKWGAAALTVGTIPGMRAYSGRYVYAHPEKFTAADVIREYTPAGGGRRVFHDDTNTLTVVKDKAGKVTAEVKIGGESKPVGAGDVLYIRPRGVTATNIHRGHTFKLGEDGKLVSIADSVRVSNWSEGCQVYPRFDDYNLFIGLAAAAKRWACVAGGSGTRASCARLDIGTGATLSSGESAVLEGFGKSTVYGTADSEKGGAVPKSIKQLEARKTKATLTAAEESRLAALLADKAAGKAWLPAQQSRLDTLQKKKDSWTETDEAELEGLKKQRDQWRVDFVREKTERLRADFLRACDAGWECKQTFTYTLVALSDADFEALESAWKDGRNKPWDGKFCLGAR